jgi:hypothetical protein
LDYALRANLSHFNGNTYLKYSSQNTIKKVPRQKQMKADREAAFLSAFAANVKRGLKARQPGLPVIHQPSEYVLQNLPKDYT